MKKNTLLTLFFAIFALFISNLFSQEITYSNLRDGNGISVSLSLNAYEITTLHYRNEVMHEIYLSGIFIPNDAGMPNLPRISRFLAIPQGADVRVAIKSMETETLQNINIAPALRIQAIPEEPEMDYVKEERVYSANQFYPQNPVEISETASLRGINTIVVGITPFQFNPVTKELLVIQNIELEIEYIGGTKAYCDPKYRSPWFDPILKNSLLNHEMLPEMEYAAKNSKNGDGCEYLIVIPNREDFRPFAEQILEFRTKQGIYTKIMRLDEMGASTTAQLKTYLHNAYKNWDIPPVAVLLMADHNTNMSLGIPAEVIPHPSPTSGTCITDNQYADVTGNLLPNMVFSRMAAESPDQMAILVSKFLEYETQPCMDTAFYQNPITALGWQTERWFQICSEAVGGYWRKQGKTPVRINKIYQAPQNTSIWSSNQNSSMVINYFGPSGTGYIPASPDELGGWDGGLPAHVVTAVNNGAFALQHRDHGEVNGWGEPAFKSSHIGQLTNVGKMTYVFTINCSTGKFNNNTPCFGEVFHRRTYQGQNAGCVGFLGPTEVSYSFVNDAFTWGMYDLFDPDFLPTFGPSYGPANGPYIGYSGNWMPAFGNVAGKYFLYQSNWPYNSGSKAITYQMFTAHSDAFLRLYTEVPQELTVAHDQLFISGSSSFSISANDGALIALTTEIDGNLVILDVATATGDVQEMTISESLIPDTEINVVVTGQNFLRYEASVMVMPDGPFIIPTGYTVENEETLTYISTNSEIAISLKNIGIEPTESVTVSISCSDPQLTINLATAACGIIEMNETVIAKFKVTVANDIPNDKIFPVDVTVTENGKNRVWINKLLINAYAPAISLEKVLVNGSESGRLEAGTLVNISAVVKNRGGADAFDLNSVFEIRSNYVTIACEEQSNAIRDLPADESTEFILTLIASADMPYAHSAAITLKLNAKYGISSVEDFSVDCSGSKDYCTNGNQSCAANDKFTSVTLLQSANQSVLFNNSNTACTSGGYQNYTNLSAELEPGQSYTLKVKLGKSNQQVRGWLDLNADNVFDNNERIISLSCNAANTEYSGHFTISENTTPGAYRFRLVTKLNESPNSCNNSGNGQTHDYTFIISEKYPRVKNVEAVLVEKTITVTWDPPQEATPTGYNLYLNGNKLNNVLLTTTSFTHEISDEGIYAYYVAAVYDTNESVFTMSNVICFSPNTQIKESLSNSYKIYPNPANGNVTIEGKGLNHVEIYDIQGRKISDYSNVSEKLQMNVNSFNNGIYFVRLYAENSVIIVKRLVIIK